MNARGGQLTRRLHAVVAGRDDDEPSDGELLRCYVRHRDAEAFARVVRRHGPMVIGPAI